MYRRSPVESNTLAPTPALPPRLIAALENMDIQLEEELERYRRQRYRQSVQRRTPASAHLSPASHPALAPAAQDDPFSLEADIWDAPLGDPAIATYPQLANLTHVSPSQLISQPNGQPIGQPIGHSTLTETPAFASEPEILDDYLASSEELVRGLSQTPNPRPQRPPSLLDTLLTPLGVGSMLLLLLSSVTLGYVMMHPSRVLTAVEPSSDSAASNPSGIPGVGSPNPASVSREWQSLSPNLAAEEFMDVNLNTLSQLPRRARSGLNTIAIPQTVPSTLTPPGLQATTIPQLPSAAGQNPSGQQITAAIRPNPTLNTVTLPAAPPVQATAPVTRPAAPTVTRSVAPAAPRAAAPAPAPSAAPTVFNPASVPVLPPPPPRVSVAPAPSLRPTTPAAQPIRTAPPAPAAQFAIAPQPISTTPNPASATSTIAQAPPSSSNRYYVVTDYNGDPSLQQARQAVQDAYVRNFDDGAKVQMGTFEDAAAAQQFVQNLQRQGVPAQVYQP
jgi:hypothetical protein